MKINIIGDIAGRYDELLELLAKMPEADLVLSVGDMVDRGPKSKQVIEYFMNTPKTLAIYGNHEDMMVESCTMGRSQNWLYNGGYNTIMSYTPEGQQASLSFVDKDHIEWLQTLPIYYETDHLFVSHAPISSLSRIPSSPNMRDYNFIWNRWEPRNKEHKFLINGHNGTLKDYKDTKGNVIGMCIDDSHHYKLTGLHWPTKEIFSVDFHREKEDEEET